MLVQIFENDTFIAIQRWTSHQLKDTALIMGFQFFIFGKNIFMATIFQVDRAIRAMLHWLHVIAPEVL